MKVGVEPDLELARASKLEVDPVHGGFKVTTGASIIRNVGWSVGLSVRRKKLCVEKIQ